MRIRGPRLSSSIAADSDLTTTIGERALTLAQYQQVNNLNKKRKTGQPFKRPNRPNPHLSQHQSYTRPHLRSPPAHPIASATLAPHLPASTAAAQSPPQDTTSLVAPNLLPSRRRDWPTCKTTALQPTRGPLAITIGPDRQIQPLPILRAGAHPAPTSRPRRRTGGRCSTVYDSQGPVPPLHGRPCSTKGAPTDGFAWPSRC